MKVREPGYGVISALNELEAASCFLATVLLAFLNTRVSG
jgi:hypothetical protein